MLLVPSCTTSAQSAAAEALANWTDPSPHKAGFVTVGRNVRIHYLDWGGSGDALIFLPGIGNTAHSFDEIAPEFTDRYRVIAITRRGQGESSRPRRGYDTSSLARDILAVMDSLGIRTAHFAGHSFAGQEMTKLAIAASSRVKKLIYLDAAFDYYFNADAYNAAALKAPVLPASPPPLAADCRNVETFLAYSARTFGISLPQGEVRHTFLRFSDGSCGRQGAIADEFQVMMSEGVELQDFRGVRVPALALYATRTKLSEEEPWKQSNAEWRAKYDSVVAIYRPLDLAQQQRFARQVAGSKVMEIAGAHHWLFVSHRERVVQEMRAFLLQ